MSKQLKKLSVVFGLLVCAIFFVANPFNKSGVISAKPIFSFDQQEINSFVINHFVNSFYLEKRDSQWFIKRVKNELATNLEAKDGQAVVSEDVAFFKANPVEVAKVLTIIMGLKIGEPIATQKKDLKVFEINDYSLHIIFYDRDKKELGRLFVGKQGPDMFSSFVKKPSSDDVYLVDQNLNGLILRNWEDWLQDNSQ